MPTSRGGPALARDVLNTPVTELWACGHDLTGLVLTWSRRRVLLELRSADRRLPLACDLLVLCSPVLVVRVAVRLLEWACLAYTCEALAARWMLAAILTLNLLVMDLFVLKAYLAHRLLD